MKKYLARLVLVFFKGESPWAAVCAHCTGYPRDYCDCNWDVRLRRWARKNA